MAAERATQYAGRFGSPVEAVSAAEQPRSGPRSPPGVHQPRARGCRVRAPAGGRSAGGRLACVDLPESILPGEKWVPAIEPRTRRERRLRRGADAGRHAVALGAVRDQHGHRLRAVSGEMRFIPLGVSYPAAMPLTWDAYQNVVPSSIGRYESRPASAGRASWTPGRTPSPAAPPPPAPSPTTKLPESTSVPAAAAPAPAVVRTTIPAVPRRRNRRKQPRHRQNCPGS